MGKILHIAHKLLFALVLFSVLCLDSGCSSNDKDITGNSIGIVRLDSVLQQIKALPPAQGDALIGRYHGWLFDQLRLMGSSVADSTQAVSDFAHGQVVAMFGPEVAKAFPNLNSEQSALGTIVARAQNQNVKLLQTEFAATIWGLPQSIVTTGHRMFIALNHYLGVEHEAYSGWPEYVRQRKIRAMIPYDIAEALVATANPYRQGTVLSHLVYQGVITYAKMQLVPDGRLDLALGLSREQLADVEAHRKDIWHALINGGLLQSSDSQVHEALFAPAPSSNLISPDAPGQAAVLVGYDIVMSYLKHHDDATLAQMLKPEFYSNSDILRLSDFKMP